MTDAHIVVRAINIRKKLTNKQWEIINKYCHAMALEANLSIDCSNVKLYVEEEATSINESNI